jgi:hypothetical protein
MYGMPGGLIPSPSQDPGWLGESLAPLFNHFFTGITNILGGFTGELGTFVTTATDAVGGLGNLAGSFAAQQKLAVFEGLKNYAKEMTKAWDALDQATFSYGKRLGMTQAQVATLRNGLLDLSAGVVNFGAHYNKTLEEVMKLQSDYSATVGRQISLTNKQLEEMAALTNVIGHDMTVKLTSGMEKFGLSVSKSAELITQMFNESAKKGISLESYSKAVTENLHIAQQYSFKEGLNGLKAMAEKATQVRMDIQQVVKLADKFSTLETAVTTSAELQVLGGPFAQFADPIALMHGSLSDMDELGDRLIDLISKFGSWNASKGQFDISDFDKMRLRQAATSMGLDYGNLVDSANRQAARSEVDRQIAHLNINEEFKELLRNTAQFENGVAGIRDRHGMFKSVSELSESDLAILAANSKSQAENIATIATLMRGALDVQEGTEKERLNVLATEKREQAEQMKGITEKLGESRDALKTLVQLQMAAAFMSNVVAPFIGLTGYYGRFGLGVLKGLGVLRANGGIVPHANGNELEGLTQGASNREYLVRPGVSIGGGEFVLNRFTTGRNLSFARFLNADINGRYTYAAYDKHTGVRAFNDGGMVPAAEDSGPGVWQSIAPMMGNPLFLSMLGSVVRNPRAMFNMSMMGGYGMMGYPMMGGGGMAGNANMSTAMIAEMQVLNASIKDLPPSAGMEFAKATNNPNIIKERVKLELAQKRLSEAGMRTDYQTKINGKLTEYGKELKSYEKIRKSYNRMMKPYGGWTGAPNVSTNDQGGIHFSKGIEVGPLGYKTQAEINAMTPSQREAYLKEMRDNERRMQNRSSFKANAAMGAVMGVMAGIGQYHSAKNQYQADGTAIMDTGKAQAGATGAAIGAGAATTLLSLIPYVGPFVGPIVGPMLGSAIGKAIGESVGSINIAESKEAYNKNYSNFTNDVGRSKYARLSTNKYTAAELDQLAGYLSDGKLYANELDSKLLQKMKALGDDKIFSQETPKYHDGGPVVVDNIYDMQIASDEQKAILQDGEYVVKARSYTKSPQLTNAINNGELTDNIFIKVLEPMGKLMEVMATELDKKSSESLKMEPLDININISGNITLEGTDVTNDMVSKLMEKKTFVDRIMDLVTVKLNYMEHNVINMKSLVNRFPNLTS